MKFTDLSILCKLESLKNWQCIKYLFAPLYLRRAPRPAVCQCICAECSLGQGVKQLPMRGLSISWTIWGWSLHFPAGACACLVSTYWDNSRPGVLPATLGNWCASCSQIENQIEAEATELRPFAEVKEPGPQLRDDHLPTIRRGLIHEHHLSVHMKQRQWPPPGAR